MSLSAQGGKNESCIQNSLAIRRRRDGPAGPEFGSRHRAEEREEAGFSIDQHGSTSFKVFFVVAPDGLCYCLGERQS